LRVNRSEFTPNLGINTYQLNLNLPRREIRITGIPRAIRDRAKKFYEQVRRVQSVARIFTFLMTQNNICKLRIANDPVNDPPTILRPSDDSVGCLGDDYCPPQCNCAGSVVRCSRSQLTEIPRGIPPETTELYLDVNDIKTIQPERLNHLRILTRL